MHHSIRHKVLLALASTMLLSGCVPKKPNVSESLHLQPGTLSLANYTKHAQSNIYFDTGSSVVEDDQYGTLALAGKLIASDNQMVVEISGHADERGDSAFNEALSKKRAETVASILYKQYSISPNRMAIVSYGEAMPASQESNERSWAKNRRVQLDIYLPKSSKDKRDVFIKNQLTEDAIESFESHSDDTRANQPKVADHKQSDPEEHKPTPEGINNQKTAPEDFAPKEPIIKTPPILENAPCENDENCGEKGLGISTGTGFFVTADGKLITNYHVIADTKGLFVVINEEMIPAGVEAYSVNDDLALLSIDQVSKPIPFTTSEPKKGSVVTVMGYPNISIQGNELKVTVGHINSLSGIQNDRNMMQFDAAIQPGNSGGPLIASTGEVVGVATATLKQDAAVATSGTLAQNVNYAVKMKQTGILEGFSKLKSSPTPGASLSPTELVEAFETSVVLIINYHDAQSIIQAERKTSTRTPNDANNIGSSNSPDSTSQQNIEGNGNVSNIEINSSTPETNSQPLRPQYIYKARPQ